MKHTIMLFSGENFSMQVATSWSPVDAVAEVKQAVKNATELWSPSPDGTQTYLSREVLPFLRMVWVNNPIALASAMPAGRPA